MFNRAAWRDRGRSLLDAAKLDRIDMMILAELLENSRRSSRDIARRLGLSVGTVATRIKRLSEDGVIRRFAVDLDLEKLGYDITVVVEVYASRGSVLKAEERIAGLQGVVAVYDVTGEYDAVIIAKFKSRSELSRFTKGLLSLESVERTNTHVVLNVIKEDFRLL